MSQSQIPAGGPSGIGGGGAVDGQPRLSPRQRQTLSHLLRGASHKEVAAALGVTIGTARVYVRELHRKYEVHSGGELMARFINAPPQ
jgi:DNA-binding NarL/FixJ family response regulator